MLFRLTRYHPLERERINPELSELYPFVPFLYRNRYRYDP